MQIITSNEVTKDMIEIYNYASNISKRYAEKTVDNIKRCIEKLKDSPYMGRYIPELDNRYFLEFVYKSYRIVYTISEDENTIYVHFIISARRNLKSFFDNYINQINF